MTQQEIERVSQADAQAFIFANENIDVGKFLLAQKDLFGVQPACIADQLRGRQKALSKIPLYRNTSGIVYPPSLNLEQSSSETTALFKCDWLKKDLPITQNFADLTGGWGVDSFFFSQITDRLVYVEPDENLFDIARHNHRVLKAENIAHRHQSAEQFLSDNKESFDLMYVDPGRRTHQNKKVFLLKDCQPDVVGLLPQLLQQTSHVLIKAAPLLDIQSALRELVHVKKIAVVSVENECRELLFLLEKDFDGEVFIETYNLTKKERQQFSFTLKEEYHASSLFGELKEFIYEPNASILKSGAFKLVGEKFGLHKLHVHTHLYTGSTKIENFPGRVFKIEKLKFDADELPEQRANVMTRNYPLSAMQLKQKLKLKDGGEKIVIGFTGLHKKYVVVAAKVSSDQNRNVQ